MSEEQDKCPKCGNAMERFGVVRYCTISDCPHMEDADELVTALRTENERLRGVVEKLPKTEDGVPVLVGDYVWFLDYYADEITKCIVAETSPFPAEDWAWWNDLSGCYSTREAAEAARKAVK